MTDLIYGLLAFIIMVTCFEKYFKWREIRAKEVQTRLNVLKVIFKHECFNMFKDKPTNFEDWVSKFLEIKGYRETLVTPRQGDGGKDIIAKDKTGKKVFIECKLWNPENWDINVGRPEVQKLVGAMVAAEVKNGLVVTTAALSHEAKEYIKQINSLGYSVQYIEGNQLVKELYNLRMVKLKPLLADI
jgi:HJR/Mrr/RecB family endonuclease